MKPNSLTVPIIEIFSSIQGEGLFIGERQIFVRLAGCNLKCNYCDTDFKASAKNMTPDDVVNYLTDKLEFDFHLHKTLVLTGGEPLLHFEFIKKFSKKIHDEFGMRLMLETNGTLTDELLEVVAFVDVVSVDFKFLKYQKIQQSGSKNKNSLSSISQKFLTILTEKHKDFYVKLVCDKNLSLAEFRDAIDKIYEVSPTAIIVIQPIQNSKNLTYHKKFDEFLKIALKKFHKTGDVLFLPQIHKFLDIK